MINIFIIAVISSLITIYVLYTISQIAYLKAKVKAFPTPEELARAILKVKLPIDDLPPDMMEKMRKISDMMANNEDNKKQIDDKIKSLKPKAKDYIN